MALGWYLLSQYGPQWLEGTRRSVSFGQNPEQTSDPLQPPLPPPLNISEKRTIRLATFYPGPLEVARLQDETFRDQMVRIIREFDLVAVHGVRSRSLAPVLSLVEQINARGSYYDFAAAVGPVEDSVVQFSVLFFDQQSLVIDRSTVRKVEDPHGLFRWKPWVASLMTRGVTPAEAFTFTVICAQVDPMRTAQELELLAVVFRAAKNDGRNEDDTLLLAHLAADELQWQSLKQLARIVPVFSGVPTASRAARCVDNILLDRIATREFTGRAGVLDLGRFLQLPPLEAAERFAFFPAWAEFSVFEGGEPGFVAQSESRGTMAR